MYKLLRLVLGVVLLTAMLVAALPAQAADSTAVGGTLAEDTTWTVDGSPYLVAETVVVPDGVTLSIEPGVTVQRDPASNHLYSLFQVSGTLLAEGTAVAPVKFTGPATPLVGGPPGEAIATATGTVRLSHVSVTGPDVVTRLSSRYASPALAELDMRDSLASPSYGNLRLTDVRAIILLRNRLALNDTRTSELEFGDGHDSIDIRLNRLRGVKVVCNGDALTLRHNTFEYMARDMWEDGSGLAAKPGCAGVDARENHWETSGDLGSRIDDGMDAPGLAIAQTDDRLEAPADGTPILPPSRFINYLQIRAYPTGLTSWWDNGSDGGSPMTYTVEALPEGMWEAEQQLETTGNSVQFRDLDTTQRYRIRVTAHNAAGTGHSVHSEAIYPVKTAVAPNAPVLDVRRFGGGAHASWRVDGDGGAPIDYFQWSLEGPEGVIEGSGGSETQRTFSSLELGKTYRVSVYAHNAIGAGPSATQEFVAADSPSRARKVRARPLRKAALVKWRAPASANGSPVTSYRLTMSRDSRTFTVSADARQKRVKRLRRGKKQVFYIQAVNAMGHSTAAPSNPIKPK